MDDQRKDFQQKIDKLKFLQKELASKKDYDGAKTLKTEIQALEDQHQKVVDVLNIELLKMPNTALHPDVPIGKDETENVVLKNFGKVPSFDFEIQDHMTLMRKYDMVDVERGVKIA